MQHYSSPLVTSAFLKHPLFVLASGR